MFDGCDIGSRVVIEWRPGLRKEGRIVGLDYPRAMAMVHGYKVSDEGMRNLLEIPFSKIANEISHRYGYCNEHGLALDIGVGGRAATTSKGQKLYFAQCPFGGCDVGRWEAYVPDTYNPQTSTPGSAFVRDSRRKLFEALKGARSYVMDEAVKAIKALGGIPGIGGLNADEAAELLAEVSIRSMYSFPVTIDLLPDSAVLSTGDVLRYVGSNTRPTVAPVSGSLYGRTVSAVKFTMGPTLVGVYRVKPLAEQEFYSSESVNNSTTQTSIEGLELAAKLMESMTIHGTGSPRPPLRMPRPSGPKAPSPSSPPAGKKIRHIELDD